MSNSPNYQRNYLISLFVWSVGIGGVLVAGPKLIERLDETAQDYYHEQFQQEHIDPLVLELEALETEKQRTLEQHQQEINKLEEKIAILEKDGRSKRLDMSYGNSELLHGLTEGDAITVSFPASIRCEPVEFGYKATVTPTVDPARETWIYTNLGECFERSPAATAASNISTLKSRSVRVGTVGQYEVGVLRVLQTSLL